MPAARGQIFLPALKVTIIKGYCILIWIMLVQQSLKPYWLPDMLSEKTGQDQLEYRLDTISSLKNNPGELLVWLYENQGTRRFDASNRLFLILIDTDEYYNSWQLKRAKPLLVDKINTYLDNFDKNQPQEIKFNWEGVKYTTISDAIFIINDE